MTDRGPKAAGWAIRHVPETGSTNADLVAAAATGAPERTVLVADVQHDGRGRMGRRWLAPPGTALTFSVLLRPERVPAARRGWAGALLGLAVARGIERRTGMRCRLKWPNDVLIDGRKVAGILAELAGDALVVGAGVNVTLAGPDLPRADATSLLLEGADRARCDRAALLDAILGTFAALLDRWYAAAGDVDAAGLRHEYLARSATVGEEVTIDLPGGATAAGRAVDVAPDGSVVIDGPDGRRRRFAAGDVHHLRLS